MKILQSIISFPFLLLIRIYQWTISPLLGQNCRHIPTCSQYAFEAIKIHGVIIGCCYSVRRISKCHPWGTSGNDPVPPKT